MPQCNSRGKTFLFFRKTFTAKVFAVPAERTNVYQSCIRFAQGSASECNGIAQRTLKRRYPVLLQGSGRVYGNTEKGGKKTEGRQRAICLFSAQSRWYRGSSSRECAHCLNVRVKNVFHAIGNGQTRSCPYSPGKLMAKGLLLFDWAVKANVTFKILAHVTLC